MMTGGRHLELIYVICAITWAAIAWSIAARDERPAYERIASTEALNRYAKAALQDVQARSIESNREYCGVIFENEHGELSTSTIYEGDSSNCQFDWGVPLGSNVIASFHTHAGYDPEYDSELPSRLDMENDIDARIEGFIATPAGRIWHIDWKSKTAHLLCGVNCIRKDPNSSLVEEFPIKSRYNIEELYAELNRAEST